MHVNFPLLLTKKYGIPIVKGEVKKVELPSIISNT